LKAATTAMDSARINKELIRLDVDLREYREKIMADNPKTILTVLLNAMKEPVLPAALQKPITRFSLLQGALLGRSRFLGWTFSLHHFF
jgi:hypothetical protein